MTQVSRPASESFSSGWTTPALGPLVTQIDEPVPADGDYIESPALPGNAVYVCRLAPVEDPQVDRDHVIRFRIQKDNPAPVRARVELREAYVSEAEPGELIADFAVDAREEWDGHTFILLPGNAARITDYRNLFLRFTADLGAP